MADKVDVVLVRMPYSELTQPSLALGLLKALCERHGLASCVLHANLWFAEEIGPVLHEMIFEAHPSTVIGEWTFAGTLFPDFRPDDEEYLRAVGLQIDVDGRTHWRTLKARYPYLDRVTLLRAVRQRTSNFIDRTADRILDHSPRIVGCTSTFQQHCASLAVLRAIKQRRKDVITMMGGANCEGEPGRVTFERFPWVDYVVSGEADGFFGELCVGVMRDPNDPMTVRPEGLWGPWNRKLAAARVQEGKRESGRGGENGHAGTQDIELVGSRTTREGAIARLEDMNESPVPNYDDYFAALQETKEFYKWFQPALPYQTARGCWWGEKHHCTFCGISRTAMKFRSKSVENVLEEIRTLGERYGSRYFQGTEYIFDYRYFATLLPKLRDIDGFFRFEVKANLKEQELKAFADAGTLEVQPGIESLHDSVLALLTKGVTTCQNLLLLKRARRVGLEVCWNMLHTIPGDKDEWYEEIAGLLPFLTHLQPPYGCCSIHYDRFSPYWRESEKHNLELLPGMGYEYVYPFERIVLKEMAYFFETPEQRGHFGNVFATEANRGVRAMVERIVRWKELWKRGSTPPRLVAFRKAGQTVFRDTRDVAVAQELRISGVEEDVYWIADEGVSLQNLENRVAAGAAGERADTQQVWHAVESLERKRLLVKVSGRLLGLGIRGPIAEYPMLKLLKGTEQGASPSPELAKRSADRALDARRRNIALDCLRSPEEEPISAWLRPVGGGVAGRAIPGSPGEKVE